MSKRTVKHHSNSTFRIGSKNPDNPVSFFCQRLNWGKGFRQLTERHLETFTTKIKLCFLWILVMLLSPLVAMIDIQFTWAFPALVAYNLLRFTPGTIVFAGGRKTGSIASSFLF